MTRGGRIKERAGPERRCVVTGASGPTDGLIRFALSPDGIATPDLAERLPGRGVWVTSDPAHLTRAAEKNLFSRGFRAQARAPEDLAGLVEAALAQRLGEGIALCRKAGLATCGFEKVKARLKQGPPAALIEARDGSEQGRAKLRPLAGEAAVIAVLEAHELGLAFGRDSVIHAALDQGGATARVLREWRRLSAFRPDPSGDAQRRPRPRGEKDG